MTKFDIYQMRHDMGLPTHIKNEITDIQYKINQKGDYYCLLTDKKYSLFFLMEGCIRIHSWRYGEKRITQGHFFYIGAQSGFSYQTEENSRCVILSFNDFQHPGNIRFIHDMYRLDSCPPDIFLSHPIKDPLLHILKTLLIYMDDGFHYPNIHEAILVLVRALYPPSEVAAMFQQMIQKQGDKEHMQKPRVCHA